MLCEKFILNSTFNSLFNTTIYRFLYDCDSKSIRKLPGKASSYIAFFNVQHTVLENKIAAY